MSVHLQSILSSVDIIYAEDTRVSATLLQTFDIKKPLKSLHAHTESGRVAQILDALADEQSVAVVSDAGTPNICDPGAYLVKQIVENGYRVVPVPGPSAVSTLLSVCGMLCDSYTFLGFFPKNKRQATTLLTEHHHPKHPVVFFETSKRLLQTLDYLKEQVSVTQLCLGKEMTKSFEQFFHGSIDEVMAKLEQATIKGEWCLAFTYELSTQKQSAETLVQELVDIGLTTKQIVYVAQSLLGYSKNEIYAHAISKQPNR